jgi:putative oxidoreductase
VHVGRNATIWRARDPLPDQALVFALRHGIVEILEIFLDSPRIGGIGRLGNKGRRTSGVEPNLLGYIACASGPRYRRAKLTGSEKTTEGVRVKTAKSRGSRVNEAAPMIVRVVQGSLMAGHGAQKLFGSFGGPGLEGTSGFMEMLGMRPGRPWAYMAGLSEFGGGLLTALGLLNPLGPLGVIGSMAMATRKAHWGKPIWVTEGGAELPLLNIAISTALMIREPDRYSLDRLLGIRLPAWVGPVGLVGIILVVLYSELETEEAPEQEEGHEEEGDQEEAREELAGP